MTDSSFGERYRDMSEREILIDLAGDMKSLRELVRSRPACPSAQCSDHEKRLIVVEQNDTSTQVASLETRVTVLEQHDANAKENSGNLIAWLGVSVAALAVVVSVIAIIAAA